LDFGVLLFGLPPKDVWYVVFLFGSVLFLSSGLSLHQQTERNDTYAKENVNQRNCQIVENVQ
jgi:hypothetical protein